MNTITRSQPPSSDLLLAVAMLFLLLLLASCKSASTVERSVIRDTVRVFHTDTVCRLSTVVLHDTVLSAVHTVLVEDTAGHVLHRYVNTHHYHTRHHTDSMLLSQARRDTVYVASRQQFRRESRPRRPLRERLRYAALAVVVMLSLSCLAFGLWRRARQNE